MERCHNFEMHPRSEVAGYDCGAYRNRGGCIAQLQAHPPGRVGRYDAVVGGLFIEGWGLKELNVRQ